MSAVQSGTSGRGREKAARLLLTGRVRVVRVSETAALVDVAGDTGRYRIELEPGRSSCSCPATARCSHRIAAELVVSFPCPEAA